GPLHRGNNWMFPVHSPSCCTISGFLSHPERDASSVLLLCALVSVDTTASNRDCTDDPLEFRPQGRRRLSYGLSDVHLPKMVELDRDVDAHACQPDQLVGRNDPEPAARHDKPSDGIDVEAETR